MVLIDNLFLLDIHSQPDERLSWSVVKLPSVSGTPSESSFKATTERRTASRDINVVLHVAPRTKLGLGICKGPEWKPGIFVQFTKERSVAREAGLRPGDQILSVNSIDFSDVLFSEAVAVMKGSSKLDMVVRTAAGCDLFPGESSGYNSSASSVTGDQSPCWADAKSKRLTAVREEPTPAGGAAVQVHKQLNKTIIKLTENGTSINSTFVANACGGQQQQREHEQTLEQLSVSRSTTMRRSCSVAAPAPPPPAAAGAAAALSSSSAGSSLSSAITEELKKRKEVKQQRLCTAVYPVKNCEVYIDQRVARSQRCSQSLTRSNIKLMIYSRHSITIEHVDLYITCNQGRVFRAYSMPDIFIFN